MKEEYRNLKELEELANLSMAADLGFYYHYRLSDGRQIFVYANEVQLIVSSHGDILEINILAKEKDVGPEAEDFPMGTCIRMGEFPLAETEKGLKENEL